MDKVRLGIIGVGNMGSAHVRSIANLTKKASLAAICDRDREKADKIAA